MDKVWTVTEIFNHCEQKILIQPEPEFKNTIEVYIGEIDKSKEYGPLYLKFEEVDVFCTKLKEMVEYVKSQNK